MINGGWFVKKMLQNKRDGHYSIRLGVTDNMMHSTEHHESQFAQICFLIGKDNSNQNVIYVKYASDRKQCINKTCDKVIKQKSVQAGVWNSPPE